jgi:hypothetical protein
MFKVFYGLTYDPFVKDVDIKLHFKSQDFIQALNRLEFLKNTRGFGVLTGEAGIKRLPFKCDKSWGFKGA